MVRETSDFLKVTSSPGTSWDWSPGVYIPLLPAPPLLAHNCQGDHGEAQAGANTEYELRAVWKDFD